MLLPPMEWIEKIIKIDSITHHSNEEIVRFLAPLLAETGLKVEEQKIVENGESFKNLIAYSHAPDSPDLLAMNTHLDTVGFGEKESWTKSQSDPFRATRVRDRIYGLGSADVKIDFLCKLWAARLCKPWKRPFVIVGTYGEERGLIGVTELFSAKRIKPKYALVGEPSNLELIYAHKGHLIFELSFALEAAGSGMTEKRWKGKSAHSSTPELGDNALKKGLNDILKRRLGIAELVAGTDSNRIPDICEAKLVPTSTKATQALLKACHDFDDLGRELRKRKDSRFSPSASTLSLNRALTRDGRAYLTFDLRNLPDMNPQQLKAKVEAIAKRNDARIESFSIDEPLKGQKNGTLMKAAANALKACGVKVVRKTKASSTEAAIYQKNGAEAIVFGPGISVGNVHRPNEHNSLRQIGIATKFYAHMLRQTTYGA